MDTGPALLAIAVIFAAAYLLLQNTQEQGAASVINDPGQDVANGIGTGANYYNTDAAGASDSPASSEPESIMQTITHKAVSFLGLWRAPEQYAATIADAEGRNGIPPGMLERLLYQECRYRADIITGAVRSGAGAVGIAQFMPATAREMGVNPLDPVASIYAAGVYLSRLYRSLGTWAKALAAYNWGIGNVQRKGLAAAPDETQKYFAQILGDVNASNGTNYT